MNRPPPLHAIYVFTICARLGSFKLAAEELCVTPGAVSRQIQVLEDYLGIALFERLFRQVSLTHAGQLYFSQVSVGMRTIDEAVHVLRDGPRPIRLGVESTPTLAMHWLIPRLHRFQQQYPHIDLQLSTSSGPVILRKGVDVYLRRDPAQFSGLVGKSFMTEISLAVCSPDFLSRFPQSCGDNMLELPLIVMRSRSDLWRRWFTQQKMDFNRAGQCRLLDNTILAIQAAVEGLGIALIPALFIKEHLQAGVLVRVPRTQALHSGGYSILPATDCQSEYVEAFDRWIHEAAAL